VAGIATAILSYPLDLTAGGRIVVNGVTDATFNGGDGANLFSTISSLTGSVIIFPTSSSSLATSTGGAVITCDSASGGQVNGVFAADVTDGSAATTQQDWTYNTLEIANTDTVHPALGNTCAEFLAGGQNPLNGVGGSDEGGRSPGLTVDTITDKIVGWPNQGANIYQITPDPVNKRWTCERQTYSGLDATAIPADNDIDGPNSTLGTWHRFSYFPGLDVFFLIDAPDQPARILRIR
jgi:hypothetical protein